MTEFKRRDLLIYYGSAYLITAILETILFSSILGKWSGIEILLTFSIWGIIWLVSMFAYPMFFTDARAETLALNPYLSLLGYVIILGVFVLTYYLNKRNAEKRLNKKLSFSRLVDLYFPAKKS
ncbi:MAG: hypothetical protein KAS63_08060 [Candidatus Heimdallarchaeota archaeon]|nr:hypothetical protein [Candidatus Heimdallarchaeota archaeon]MCK4955304.1 hypothetical protein [Candidatus Heimdallarchaeota archaeon]